MTNYYAILGLPMYAQREAVRAAFKKLAFQFHPDRNPGNPEAEERFKAINEAYHVLYDPVKKDRYDALMRNGGQPQQRVQPPPSPDPRYRRRAPYIRRPAPTVERDPTIPSNFVTSLLAAALVVYSFMVVNTVLVIVAQLNYYWATQAVAQQQYKQAYELLVRATRFDTGYQRAHILNADICLQHLGKPFDAIEHYTEAIDLAPGFDAELYAKRGLAYSYASMFHRRAAHDLAQALPALRQNAALLKQVAQAYQLRLYEPQKAYDCYRQVIALQQADPEVYMAAAEIAQAQNRHQQAIEHLSAFIGLQASNAQAYFLRAISYYELQNQPASCTDWATARRLDTTLVSDYRLSLFCQQ